MLPPTHQPMRCVDRGTGATWNPQPSTPPAPHFCDCWRGQVGVWPKPANKTHNQPTTHTPLPSKLKPKGTWYGSGVKETPGWLG